MQKILVTGATGQLGSEFKVLSKNYPQFEWFFADRTQVSLDKINLLGEQLKNIQPNIILNCGAYTAVDKAETENELADIVNHQSVSVVLSYPLSEQQLVFHNLQFCIIYHYHPLMASHVLILFQVLSFLPLEQ